MSESPQISQWEHRYSNSNDYLFGIHPNDFLLRHTTAIKPGGRVLSIADGEGRNGVFLAEQGFEVHTLEGSATAVERARLLSTQRAVGLTIEQGDLFQWSWPRNEYDAVVAIFIQFATPEQRDILFSHMKQTVKPGGVILLEGYHTSQPKNGTGGPANVQHLYTEELLRDYFSDMVIEELCTYEAVISEGNGHSGLSALVDLVARKGSS